MITAMRNYISDWEKLEAKAKLNVEYLPSDPVNYSLMEEPLSDLGRGVGVVRQFLNGKAIKEYRVRLLRVAHYEEPTATNIGNSRFMRDFEAWIDKNNKTKQFPEIEGILSIETTTNGYIESVSNDQTEAVYTVGLRITYIN